MTTYYRQCTFKCGNSHTTAWIVEKSAKVGKRVYFKDDDQDPDKIWTVTSVGGRKTEDEVKDHERDYKKFYSGENLIKLGIAFSTGGIMANTPIDENIQDWYQIHARNSGTNELAKRFKIFGEGEYLLPITLLSAGIDYCITKHKKSSLIGTWGQLSARAYLVGGPALALSQRLTGASRPGETQQDSQWQPLNDDNGVSGHAFVGAIPFLTIARMLNSHVLLKNLFYGISTFTAFSRINDNKHYFSQAALGTDNICRPYCQPEVRNCILTQTTATTAIPNRCATSNGFPAVSRFWEK